MIAPLPPAVRLLLAWWLMWHLPPAAPFEAPLPAWWNGGRVVTTPTLHVGVRPAADLGDLGVGITVQVTTSALPW